MGFGRCPASSLTGDLGLSPGLVPKVGQNLQSSVGSVETKKAL